MEKSARFQWLLREAFGNQIPIPDPISKETKTAIRKAIRSLRPDVGIVMGERYLNETSVAKIAASFPNGKGGHGVHPSTINQKRIIGLRNLRNPQLSNSILATLKPGRSGAEWAEFFQGRTQQISKAIEARTGSISLAEVCKIVTSELVK